MAVCSVAWGQSKMSQEPEYLIWVGSAAMLAVPGYFILQTWFASRWSGSWRIAALVPLIAMVPAVLFSMFALSQGSNLWPITVFLLAPLGFIYLVVVWASRAIADWAAP
jgi:hypothetical protein